MASSHPTRSLHHSEEHAQPSLDTLPPELFLLIMQHVPIIDLVPLLCALHRTFDRHGLVPGVTRAEFRTMEAAYYNRALHSPPSLAHGVAVGTAAAAATTAATTTAATGVASLPAELTLIVGESLVLEDRISFAVATWPCFYPSRG